MGKTKTAIVTEVTGEKKTSEELYREKKERQSKEAALKQKPKDKPEKIHIAGLKGGQRIKVVEAAAGEETPSTPAETETKKKKEPKIRGKKYLGAKTKIEAGKKYPAKDAIKLVKETSFSSFDGTVELHLVVKKTGLSAQVTLPFQAGKVKKVEVANDETIKKLTGGKIDFDILLATAEMMPKLIPFAKILGPKGLMPNPKNNTLIKSAKDAEKFSGNAMTLKTEKEAPLIHTVLGKVSQKDTELIANLEAIIKAISDKQIIKAYLKATMGPSVKLALT